MRKITIPKIPEQAAIYFAEENKSMRASRVSFAVIPKAIGSSMNFWLKLVELEPKYIARVPLKIIECEEFAKMVDHVLFYEYLPKKYLNAEDYLAHRINPEASIKRKLGFLNRAEICSHNEYTWYMFDGYPTWISASNMTPNEIIGHLGKLNLASELFPELWSQELADKIMNSKFAIISYEDIPKEFIRPEWTEIMKLYKEVRFPTFGLECTKLHPEKLSEYWSKFKTKAQMKMAIALEELIKRCCIPSNYRMNVQLSPVLEKADCRAYYKKMYSAVKGTIEKDPSFMESFFKMYGADFSMVVPEGRFKLEWIAKSQVFRNYLDDYRMALNELSEAETEVERLEAQETVDFEFNSLKKLVKSYRKMRDEDLNSFINAQI